MQEWLALLQDCSVSRQAPGFEPDCIFFDAGASGEESPDIFSGVGMASLLPGKAYRALTSADFELNGSFLQGHHAFLVSPAGLQGTIPITDGRTPRLSRSIVGMMFFLHPARMAAIDSSAPGSSTPDSGARGDLGGNRTSSPMYTHHVFAACQCRDRFGRNPGCPGGA